LARFAFVDLGTADAYHSIYDDRKAGAAPLVSGCRGRQNNRTVNGRPAVATTARSTA